MAPTPDQGAPSPVTARAVCLGLFLSSVINLVMAYNDYYLYNSLLIGNHFPVISIVIVFTLVVVGGWLGRRERGFAGFSAGELLLIWSMIGIAGGICAAGIMRYFPPWSVVPAYYTTASNEYTKYVLQHMPDWMVLSKDPDSDAVKWFMEGLPHGESIPWGEWVVPMIAWGAFMTALYCSNFALISLFFHQWSVRERLIFPLIHLPLEMSRPAPKGRILNEFLSNRLTWLGIAIPLLIWGWNGLRTFFPGMPLIPMSYGTWGLFADRPWSEFHMDMANIYFTVIGLTFLLTTEIAFSMWFFYFLYRLSYVYIAWLGAGATGFWGNWGVGMVHFETTGATIVIAGFLFLTARRAIGAWFGRVLRGQHDPAEDPLSPRVALALMVAGVGGMFLWFLLSGTSWWASLITVVVFLSIILVLTRIVAEAGIMFVQAKIIAYDVVTGIFPPAWIGGPTLTTLIMHKAMLMHDLREILMPYVMNGLKAAAVVRMHLGKALAVFALTCAVGMTVSAYGRIATSYKYGGVNLDQHANINTSAWLETVSNFQKNPPSYDFVKIGDTPVLPVNLAHIVVGGTASAIMLVLRAKFLWWPLHPFGLVVSTDWAMCMIWFSILIGWLAKVCIMTFGGASVYRKALPFFLGMVLGEAVISAFWMILGMITGIPGLHVLPN